MAEDSWNAHIGYLEDEVKKIDERADKLEATIPRPDTILKPGVLYRGRDTEWPPKSLGLGRSQGLDKFLVHGRPPFPAECASSAVTSTVWPSFYREIIGGEAQMSCALCPETVDSRQERCDFWASESQRIFARPEIALLGKRGFWAGKQSRQLVPRRHSHAISRRGGTLHARATLASNLLRIFGSLMNREVIALDQAHHLIIGKRQGHVQAISRGRNLGLV